VIHRETEDTIRRVLQKFHEGTQPKTLQSVIIKLN